MTYTREHDLAKEHPICRKGIDDAEKAVVRAKAADKAKAARLRDKAQKMLDEALELEYRANRYSEYETVYAELRSEIEDKAYWAARAAIGVLPRDENGDYTTPAPWWDVTLRETGEFIGQYQGEERSDVLRVVCPKDSNNNWSDFDVERSKWGKRP